MARNLCIAYRLAIAAWDKTAADVPVRRRGQLVLLWTKIDPFLNRNRLDLKDPIYGFCGEKRVMTLERQKMGGGGGDWEADSARHLPEEGDFARADSSVAGQRGPWSAQGILEPDPAAPWPNCSPPSPKYSAAPPHQNRNIQFFRVNKIFKFFYHSYVEIFNIAKT